MELRVLRYFLAVAREESISGAAATLHVTQPTLSRQMMELEEELGKTLFLRGKRKISLTEEGMFLRKRAQEIVTLVEKTESEFSAAEETISGDVHIGGGETDAMRLIARAAHRLQSAYPHIAYHLFSGNADDVTERLDRGLVDFGVFIEPADLSKYDFIKLPVTDIWGVLMRKDCPLAARATIRPQDLLGLPLTPSSEELAALVSNHKLGKKVAFLYDSFKDTYVVKEEVVPGDPTRRTVIRKPEIYNAVRTIEKELNRQVRKDLLPQDKAEQEFTGVLKVALAAIDSDTESFETALQENKKDVSHLLGVFRRVSLKSIY